MSSGIKLRFPVVQGDHSRGSRDAPLVLVEYGDYECSYCAGAHVIIKKLQRALGSDLRLVFRNFPLIELHPLALGAARAAEAAALQGFFWEMHDSLYDGRDELEPSSLRTRAIDLGLDLAKFSQDMEGPAVEEKINHDLYGGSRSGVSGTPSFFINGFKYDGSYSYASLLGELMKVRDSGALKAS